ALFERARDERVGAGQIDEGDRAPVERKRALKRRYGDAGVVADAGRAAGEVVEQRALAGVWVAGDHHPPAHGSLAAAGWPWSDSARPPTSMWRTSCRRSER